VARRGDPLTSPRDRSKVTYFAVAVDAGAKKTCKVAWSPPPVVAGAGVGAVGAERRFVVESRAPEVLRPARPEFAVAAGGGPLSVKFQVSGPAGLAGATLEALVEMYEVREGGGRAAVDMLEFTVQVTAAVTPK